MRRIHFLFLIMFAGVLTAGAQTTPKIGYADAEYIFSKMPEAKQIESELKVTETQLAAQINKKTTELQEKYNAFVNAEKTMLAAVRESNVRELEMLQQNLEKLKQDAQVTYQKKYAQLLEPIYSKIGDAINAVAKENGYAFVLNPRISGQDVVLYVAEGFDISDLVLKNLGVAVTPVAANTSQPN